MSNLNTALAGSLKSGHDLLFPLPTSAADIDGWERFVSRYGGFLARCVRRGFRLIGERCLDEDVEDIVQSLYARLLEEEGRRLRNFEGTTEEELLAYLGRMACRLAADARREARAVKRGGGVSLQIVRDLESKGNGSLDSRPSPEERVLTLEGCRRAISAALPTGATWAYRSLEILHLSLVEGKTSREISQGWGGSLHPSTIDSSLYRMRRRLAQSQLRLADLESSA